jgi:ribonuclease HI
MARLSTGLPPTTRSSKVLRCAHLPPLTAWLDWISTKYAINIITLPADHGLRPLPAYQSYLAYIEFSLLLIYFLLDKLETRSNLSLPIVEPLQLHINKPQNPDEISDTNRVHESWIHKLISGMIVVYTDGSRDDKGCTGAGWILYQKQQTSLNTIVNGSCNLGLRSEVFDAELHAVYESLTYLISSSLKPNQIHVCIDSKSTIDILKHNPRRIEGENRSQNAAQILRTNGWLINTVWVPSHSGKYRGAKTWR